MIAAVVTWYALILVFQPEGLDPRTIQIAAYASRALCESNGKKWQSPEVDKAHAIVSYTCEPSSP